MTTPPVKSYTRFTFEEWESFVRTWQGADSAETAAQKLGLTVPQAKAKAAALRKLGVELRKFKRGIGLSQEEVRKLRATARAVMAQLHIVQTSAPTR